MPRSASWRPRCVSSMASQLPWMLLTQRWQQMRRDQMAAMSIAAAAIVMTATHCDVKALLTNWEPPVKGEGLDEWAQAFGIAGKTGGMNGAAVYPAYVAGDIVGIASYCLGDVAATSRIYHAIGPTLDPEY